MIKLTKTMKLKININIETEVILKEEWLKRVSQKIFKLLEKEGSFLFDINLVNSKTIQEVNKKFRNKDKPTTILTFVEEDVKDSFISPESSFKYLGEIFLCPSQIEKQSQQEYKISTKKLMTRMLIHGILHLLGYTHENEKKAQIMEKREGYLIEQLAFFS